VVSPIHEHRSISTVIKEIARMGYLDFVKRAITQIAKVRCVESGQQRLHTTVKAKIDARVATNIT